MLIFFTFEKNLKRNKHTTALSEWDEDCNTNLELFSHLEFCKEISAEKFSTGPTSSSYQTKYHFFFSFFCFLVGPRNLQPSSRKFILKLHIFSMYSTEHTYCIKNGILFYNSVFVYSFKTRSHFTTLIAKRYTQSDVSLSFYTFK